MGKIYMTAKEEQETQVAEVEPNHLGKMGITKTIIHETYKVPMEYHRLVRVEHSYDGLDTYVTFASYFNKDAYDQGGMYLDMISTRVPLVKVDNTTVLDAVVALTDDEFSEGVVI